MQPPDWVQRFYAAVDSGADALAHFAPDVEVQFAARPAVVGRAAAGRTLADFHAPLAGVRHELRNVWTPDADTAICEFRAHYTLRRGGELTLPSCTVLRRGADGIASMRVYLDEGPLRA
jgi:ketosteroid isomerase-like protein